MTLPGAGILLRLCLLAIIFICTSQSSDAKNVTLPEKVPYEINLFYSTVIYFPRQYWLQYIRNQLDKLKSDGLASYVSRVVVSINIDDTTDRDKIFLAVSELSEHIYVILPNAEVYIGMKTKHQYGSFRKMWAAANSMPPERASRTVFLYMYSLGMMQGDLSMNTSKQEELLYNTTVKPWRKILDVFEKCEKVQKAGYLVSHVGHLFEEFAWLRPAYLKMLEDPLQDVDAVYYETWFGRGDPVKMNGGGMNSNAAYLKSSVPSTFIGPSGGWSLCNPSLPVGFGAYMKDIRKLCQEKINIHTGDTSDMMTQTQSAIQQVKTKKGDFETLVLPFMNSVC